MAATGHLWAARRIAHSSRHGWSGILVYCRWIPVWLPPNASHDRTLVNGEHGFLVIPPAAQPPGHHHRGPYNAKE